MLINDKSNPKPSTETPPFTINTAAHTPAQEEAKQKVNTKKDILVGLYRKGYLGQPSQSARKKIKSRETTLKKYQTNLKQNEAARKRQQKFRVNQKRKVQAIKEQTGAKL